MKIFPTKKEILLSPNIIIAYTGSTDCTSGEKIGSFNVQGYDGPPTKTADNTEMKFECKFYFRGMITYGYGQEKTVVLFQDCNYIKNTP